MENWEVGNTYKGNLKFADRFANELAKEQSRIPDALVDSMRQMIMNVCETFFVENNVKSSNGLLIHCLSAKFAKEISILPKTVSMEITDCHFEVHSKMMASARMSFLDNDSCVAEILVDFTVVCENGLLEQKITH